MKQQILCFQRYKHLAEIIRSAYYKLLLLLKKKTTNQDRDIYIRPFLLVTGQSKVT